ncbi:restriction endonuclease [Hymenobacter sp. BT18]|uniref:HNH endonuclease n=1 Tax=Hymenobacter sp. BT18 TaxID=2835648 RepID=UPI00143E37ED|nr:HNH endonuclease [Hymenobacter sp. BT18]QIX62740.1 restriction endonuclease [Hymenobacter sp. BT18]
MPVIIVENDESEWNDATGESYHFPRRYLQYLQPGTPVIYYKGKQRDSRFAQVRLDKNPYYFGVAEVGKITPDANSTKGDQFCEILHYRSFEHPVPASNPVTKETLELIPESRASNFWRDGVRPCSQEVFDRIIAASGLVVLPASVVPTETNDDKQGAAEAYETIVEDGTGRKVYGTRYERNPRLRARALQLHGSICKGCGFDFEKVYGEHGRGYIHVHHLNPIASTGGMLAVNPLTDMTVLCANCHSMVHRYPKKMLSLPELRALILRTASA